MPRCNANVPKQSKALHPQSLSCRLNSRLSVEADRKELARKRPKRDRNLAQSRDIREDWLAADENCEEQPNFFSQLSR